MRLDPLQIAGLEDGDYETWCAAMDALNAGVSELDIDPEIFSRAFRLARKAGMKVCSFDELRAFSALQFQYHRLTIERLRKFNNSN